MFIWKTDVVFYFDPIDTDPNFLLIVNLIIFLDLCNLFVEYLPFLTKSNIPVG